MIRARSIAMSLLPMALGMAACSHYAPKPITPLKIEAALATPRADVLRVEASQLRHPLLPKIVLDPAAKLTPDSAAVLAVLLNPSLRAARDQRQAARAQLLQAGILPNPQLSYNADFVTGGDTTGTFNAYGLGLSWEVTSLITRDAKVQAAQAQSASVELDIAWQEWQTAESAKQAVFDLAAIDEQVQWATEIDRQLTENANILRKAVDLHEKSIVDFAGADATERDAHATLLSLRQQHDHQEMVLRRAIGLPPEAHIELAADLALPSELNLPAAEKVVAELSDRRLDLVALRLGYKSEEQTLRAEILAQFPKINIGYNQESDNTNVHSSGIGVTVDLPIFDRNQGVIAQETATRQRLYDEYTARVFEARNDIATALADIRALTDQIADAKLTVKSLQQLVDMYKSAYDRGNADVISYYTAVTNLEQKSLDLLKLQQQLWDNQIAFELAAGWYVPAEHGRQALPRPTVPAATEPTQ